MPRKLTSVVKPVPDDITVAQACVPLPICTVAEELGLTREDYDEHGKCKAKARAPHLGALGALLLVAPHSPHSRVSPHRACVAGQAVGAGEAGKPAERILWCARSPRAS